MQTFQQVYNYGLPPVVGNGSGVALRKSPKFNILPVDKYGLNVTSRDQFTNQNNLSYDVDVRFPDGSMALNGSNYETGLRDTNYTFSYDKNAAAFGSIVGPQRSYNLVFKLSEASPSSTSSGHYSVYHNAAQISGITSVSGGTGNTGKVEISLNLLQNNYYSISKFDIYSGNASNFAVVTGTGAGSNLLKSVTAFDQKSAYTLTINEGEQPSDESYYFYKILPYDDFGSGVLYSSPPISGLMHSLRSPAYSVNNLTGRDIVIIKDGLYSIASIHSGDLIGTDYNIVDIVANISGNIISGNYYNSNAVGDFDQRTTQLFKTIKYTAQTIDGSGNVSSREIIITDNSTSSNLGFRTGLIYSEYAISDSNLSAQFLVSGSGIGVDNYTNGSGYICLLAKVNYPTGEYKLYRTIL